MLNYLRLVWFFDAPGSEYEFKLIQQSKCWEIMQPYFTLQANNKMN